MKKKTPKNKRNNNNTRKTKRKKNKDKNGYARGVRTAFTGNIKSKIPVETVRTPLP